jgi:hypothetical protein
MSLRTKQPNPQGIASNGDLDPLRSLSPPDGNGFPLYGTSGSSVPHPSHVAGKCEPAHALIGKSSVRSESEAATDGGTEGGYCSQQREGTMPAGNGILAHAALTMGLLFQGSPCFGDDQTKLHGTWKLIAFMTEDVTNKVRENVCEEQAEGYLSGFATTKRGQPLPNTSGSSDASRPIISYSGNYRFQGSNLAAKVDLVWEHGWPRTDELHHYRFGWRQAAPRNYPGPLSECIRQ